MAEGGRESRLNSAHIRSPFSSAGEAIRRPPLLRPPSLSSAKAVIFGKHFLHLLPICYPKSRYYGDGRGKDVSCGQNIAENDSAGGMGGEISTFIAEKVFFSEERERGAPLMLFPARIYDIVAKRTGWEVRSSCPKVCETEVRGGHDNRRLSTGSWC